MKQTTPQPSWGAGEPAARATCAKRTPPRLTLPEEAAIFLDHALVHDGVLGGLHAHHVVPRLHLGEAGVPDELRGGRREIIIVFIFICISLLLLLLLLSLLFYCSYYHYCCYRSNNVNRDD